MSSQFINGYTNGADFQGYCATIALLLHIYSKIEAARDQRLRGADRTMRYPFATEDLIAIQLADGVK